MAICFGLLDHHQVKYRYILSTKSTLFGILHFTVCVDHVILHYVSFVLVNVYIYISDHAFEYPSKTYLSIVRYITTNLSVTVKIYFIFKFPCLSSATKFLLKY
jgi:hypothetical protein